MQPESFEQAGNNIIEAIEEGDGTGLAAYMVSEELEFTGANPKVLSTFLRNFYGPRLKGFNRDGRASLEPGEWATYYYQSFKHPDGRTNTVSVALNRNGKHVIVAPILSGLVYTAMRTELPAGKPLPNSREKFVFIIDTYGRHKAALSATGLRGITAGEPSEYLHSTWDEYLEMFRDKVRQIDERQAHATSLGD